MFSLEQLLDPEVGGIELSRRTANIESVEKVDDMTIQINFIDPIAKSLNLANLAQSTYMVPPAYFQEVGFEHKPPRVSGGMMMIVTVHAAPPVT